MASGRGEEEVIDYAIGKGGNRLCERRWTMSEICSFVPNPAHAYSPHEHDSLSNRWFVISSVQFSLIPSVSQSASYSCWSVHEMVRWFLFRFLRIILLATATSHAQMSCQPTRHIWYSWYSLFRGEALFNARTIWQLILTMERRKLCLKQC